LEWQSFSTKASRAFWTLFLAWFERFVAFLAAVSFPGDADVAIVVPSPRPSHDARACWLPRQIIVGNASVVTVHVEAEASLLDDQAGMEFAIIAECI